MLRKLLFIIGCIGVSLVAGCASTAGNKFDDSKISLIKNGISTKENVLSLLGAPYLKNTTLDGTLTWSYHYTEANSHLTAMSFVPIIGGTRGGATNVNAKELGVSFNKSGVVVSCVYRTSQREGSGYAGGITAGITGAGEDAVVNCEDFK